MRAAAVGLLLADLRRRRWRRRLRWTAYAIGVLLIIRWLVLRLREAGLL